MISIVLFVSTVSVATLKESDQQTLIAASLLCFLMVTVGIFVAIVTNFKKEPQTEGSTTSFGNMEAVYKHLV